MSWSDGSKVMYRRLDGKDPGQEADRDGDGEAVVGARNEREGW